MTSFARRHLDKKLDRMRPVSHFARPQRGWIRAIREALGITAEQVGKRMKVSQSRISALERAEVDGSATITSMQRAAEALGCTFVYALVPHQPLEEVLINRARAVAADKLARIDQTMRLENQGISAAELESERERLARTLAETPRRLWG
jgi:predicted DNA-binding mobile mystery protein A